MLVHLSLISTCKEDLHSCEGAIVQEQEPKL